MASRAHTPRGVCAREMLYSRRYPKSAPAGQIWYIDRLRYAPYPTALLHQLVASETAHHVHQIKINDHPAVLQCCLQSIYGNRITVI